MKLSPLFWYLLIAVLLIGIMIGFPIGQGCKKCPEVKPGTTVIIDTITVHDTIKTEKTRDEITVVKKKKPAPAVKDTPTVVVPQKPDSTVCYDFDEREKDGAYIKVDVCSDSLPVVKPLDLKATIFYQAPPDTAKKIFRVDTVMVNKTTPLYKDWRFYVGLTLALVGGVFLGGR